MQAFIGIVLGQRGAGKSHMTFNTLLPLCPAPVFILDTLGGDIEVGLHFDDLQELATHVLHYPNYSGVYVFNSSNDEESKAFFAVVYEIAKSGRGPLTLMVDEIDKFCSSHTVDESLDEMVRYGRRYGINCIFASRRTAEINRGIRSQADFFVSFRQSEPGDVKAIRERSDSGATKVPNLTLYRNTGEHSQFIIIGELPDTFQAIQQMQSCVN